MEILMLRKDDAHCRRCKHFRELGHVAHFCRAKETVMSESRAQICGNYIQIEIEERGDKRLEKVVIASRY